MSAPTLDAYALTITVAGDGVLDASNAQLSALSSALVNIGAHILGTVDDRLAGHQTLRRVDNLPRREVSWTVLGLFPSHTWAEQTAKTMLEAARAVCQPTVSSASAVLYAIAPREDRPF